MRTHELTTNNNFLITEINSSVDFYGVNPCALLNCIECCKDMVFSMTLTEFWHYIGKDLKQSKPYYYGSYNKLQSAVHDQRFNRKDPIVYGCRYDLGRIESAKLEAFITTHSSSKVYVYINGNCLNLVDGNCIIHEDPNRPEQCSKLKFNDKQCQDHRVYREHPSIVPITSIPVINVEHQRSRG